MTETTDHRPSTNDPRGEVVLALTTVPDGPLGEAIANALVTERLAACVNVHGPMSSTYRWRGTVEHDVERQVVIKTTRARVDAVRERISQLHSYDLPEFLVVPVAGGSPRYLEWVLSETA